MARKVTRYTDKLIAIVIKECATADYKEVAAKYGIPKSTVSTWINRKTTVSTPVNNSEVLYRLNEINNKIDKLIQAWEIK